MDSVLPKYHNLGQKRQLAGRLKMDTIRCCISNFSAINETCVWHGPPWPSSAARVTQIWRKRCDFVKRPNKNERWIRHLHPNAIFVFLPVKKTPIICVSSKTTKDAALHTIKCQFSTTQGPVLEQRLSPKIATDSPNSKLYQWIKSLSY